jgi:PqqD family protein of HPr-rel-A system
VTPIRYRAASPATLRIVPLDVLTLIYHRASGMTHIVDAPVPEILEVLGDEALSSAALMQRLAERFDLRDPDPVALAVRLDELAAAGLVERLCAM